MVRNAPEDHQLSYELSLSWYEVGKAHWQVDRTEEAALDDCRQALAAMQRACTLAPTVAYYRRLLDSRYMELGRKLCKLGHLDEAEACFRERQALWPGDAARQAESVQYLRSWAARFGDGKNLSPQDQQYRQRYLDLCDRLERKGISAAPAAGGEKP